MKELFMFTIGPVQGFIAQSRKTRDLYAGSMILSSLIKVCVQRLIDQTGATIIYPYHDPTLNDAQSMPNKFLAELTITDTPREEIGRDIELTARKHFKSLAQNTIPEMRLQSIGQDFNASFSEQIETHLEVYWAFQTIQDDDYLSTHKLLNQKLAAIKNYRPFRQLPDDEKNRKCSITGERDALIFGREYTYGHNEHVPAFVNNNKIALSKSPGIQLDKGEGLSAIMALKRFYQSASFPSTAEIAAYDFIQRVSNMPVTSETRRAWDAFKILDTDGQLLYKENYDVNYLERNGYGTQINLPLLTASYSALKAAVKKDNISMPSPYYAIIQFDGDKMGPTWSGNLLANHNQLKEFQQQLAKQLHVYANEAKSLLVQPVGRSVYAGGDDFLGFINLNYLFKTISALRNNYRGTVNDEMRPYLADYPPELELSFSAGIVIAHYKTPLTEVLSAARTAQAISKEAANRNAFAITLMKRSGEIQQAHMKWGSECSNVALIERITSALQQEIYSNTFIKSLETELTNLTGRAAQRDNLISLNELVQHEINRLVKRSKIKPIETDSMVNDVTALYHNSDSVENFLHWLHIADFLHRKPE
jgi:CRISPR-associated protein Cmr2